MIPEPSAPRSTQRPGGLLPLQNPSCRPSIPAAPARSANDQHLGRVRGSCPPSPAPCPAPVREFVDNLWMAGKLRARVEGCVPIFGHRSGDGVHGSGESEEALEVSVVGT